MRLSSLGEDELLELIIDEFTEGISGSPLSKYDDAVALPVGDLWVLVKIDGTSATTSKYPWQSWESFGFRTASSAATDIIAKGGRPLVVMASIGAPKQWEVESLRALVKGISNLARSIGAVYCGGDLNSSGSGEVWLDITIAGKARKLVPNTPLRIGEVAYVSGCLGISSIPYIVYSKKLDYRVWEDVLNKAMYPRPPLKFLDVIKNYAITASTDISDGLRSILRILKLSNVALKVKELPLCNEVIEFMRETKTSVDEIIRYMGEEMVIFFTSKDEVKECCEVGVISEGAGIIIDGKLITEGGWDNFKGFLRSSA
ncbi:MAG: hypothetical protein J7L12_04455 [Desulfurococcales archaeon]|nr:hypothetical protein [Desulfurococcales archaeon]